MRPTGLLVLVGLCSLVTACGDDAAPATQDLAMAAVPPDMSTVIPPGPGATLKCDSSGKNAFETYGASAFVAVNEQIVANVLADLDANGTTKLGDSFTKIGSGNPPSTADDVPTFKGKLAAFLVYAYGGPADIMYTDGKSYHGPQDMVAAHTGLAITSEQFDYFIANIVVPALTTKGVKAGAGGAADPNDVSSCFAPVVTSAAFKASIVGR